MPVPDTALALDALAERRSSRREVRAPRVAGLRRSPPWWRKRARLRPRGRGSSLLPYWFVQWNQHDGLIGVGRCHGVRGGIGGCVSGAVERTSDGGRTYHVVLRTRQPIGYLQTIGANGAVATTFRNDSWRTLDGGRTWQKVSPNRTVDWLNPRVGTRFRSYRRQQGRLALLVTDNGGRTWQRRPDPCQTGDVAFNAIADLVTPTVVGRLRGPAAAPATRRRRSSARATAAGPGRREPPRSSPDAASTSMAASRSRVSGRACVRSGRLGAFDRKPWHALRLAATEGRTSTPSRVAHPDADFAGGAAAFSGGVGYVLIG